MFEYGDIAIANNKVEFIDGSKHSKYQEIVVNETNIAYFNLNSRLYTVKRPLTKDQVYDMLVNSLEAERLWASVQGPDDDQYLEAAVRALRELGIPDLDGLGKPKDRMKIDLQVRIAKSKALYEARKLK